MPRPLTAYRNAALVVLAAALAPGPALACSCTNQLTLEQEFGFAAAVFSGRVLSIETDTYLNVLRVEFEPIARWKGGLEARVLVFTAITDGECGFPFVEGAEYLVFGGGTGPAPPYGTHLCSRTGPLLGNPYVPLLGPPLVPTAARPRGWAGIKRHYR